MYKYIYTYIYKYVYIRDCRSASDHGAGRHSRKVYAPTPVHAHSLPALYTPCTLNHQNQDYRSTSLIKNSADLGPYGRIMPRALRQS